MKQRLYITGQMGWDSEIELSFSKDNSGQPYDWNVPLGAIEIEVPDDVIPTETVWNALKEKHKIRCAKYKITQAQVVLRKAEEELREMLAITVSE